MPRVEAGGEQDVIGRVLQDRAAPRKHEAAVVAQLLHTQGPSIQACAHWLSRGYANNRVPGTATCHRETRVQGYWWGRLGLLGACALAQLVLLGGPTGALPAEPPAPVPTAFDGTRAYAAVRELVERYPRRTTGSDVDAAAASWMAERLAALGLPVQEQSFRARGTWGEERLALHAGRNVVAVSAGADPRAVVIGAHRDVAPGTVQGAEDNGSGSGALLEMARVLSAAPHRLSFVFVSLGAEEIGLGGSRYYL